jgi:hypothetical protein
MREIGFSETMLWSDKPTRVIRFEEAASEEIAYRPTGDGNTFLPRLSLRSGEKAALTRTGCEDRYSAEEMTQRVSEALGTKP